MCDDHVTTCDIQHVSDAYHGSITHAAHSFVKPGHGAGGTSAGFSAPEVCPKPGVPCPAPAVVTRGPGTSSQAPGLSSEGGARGAQTRLPPGPATGTVPSASLTSRDLSCIVLFGACIEGVILRDKYVGSICEVWFS